jgi:delta 1-pyrroline-5-carboxylate dehydrogenase
MLSASYPESQNESTLNTLQAGGIDDMAREYQYYCGGEWRSSSKPLEVTNPYDGAVVGTTSYASADDLEHAISSAKKAFKKTRKLQTYERAAIIQQIENQIRKEGFTAEYAVRVVFEQRGDGALPQFERQVGPRP